MSKYRIYSDQELLNLVDDKRHQSHLINELCLRLEKKHFNDVLYAPSETCESVLESITCPICEAKITLETNTDETKDN